MDYNYILNKISPNSKEESKVKKFSTDLIRTATVVSGLECSICGSIGKFTWLKGSHDIDLFIFFTKEMPREELEEKGLEFGKRIAKEIGGTYIVKYAEHPYTQVKSGGFMIDIVPCYRIRKDEKIVSAVDRSPLHLEYVLSKLNIELRKEVRLLKQFCKAGRLYGSDAKTLGFSGYICELLVIAYGSFDNVIKSSSVWSAPVIIDIENIKKRRFKDQSLIIIDPVDGSRNAAANLSAGNFIRFVYRCKKFLEQPSANFFSLEKESALSKNEIRKMKERETKFIALSFKKPDMIDDNLYPQLRRVIKRIETFLIANGFALIRAYEFCSERCYILLEFDVWNTPKIKKMIGPYIFSHKHSTEFLEKYKDAEYGPYVEGMCFAAEKRRACQNASMLLKELIKNKERLREIGIPETLLESIRKSKLLEHNDFWAEMKKNKTLSAFVRARYFEKL